MSKLNKLFLAVQTVLILVIYFAMPNSIILQLALFVNMFFTIYTLAFAETTDDEIVMLEREINSIRNSATNEMIRLDAVVDELNSLTKKAKKTTRKTTKK